MARVEIYLNGERYAVSCEDGAEDRLKDIAAFVDAKMRGIAAAKGGMAETQALVLVALTLGDQIFDLRNDLAKARTAGGKAGAADDSQDARAAGEIEALAKRIDSVASKLAKV